MEWRPLGDLTWGKILLAAIGIFMVTWFYARLSDRKISASEMAKDALERAFFGAMQKQIWFYVLVILAIPSWITSALILLAYATLAGLPARSFTQENFYYAFLPSYGVTLVVAACWWWRTDKN